MSRRQSAQATQVLTAGQRAVRQEAGPRAAPRSGERMPEWQSAFNQSGHWFQPTRIDHRRTRSTSAPRRFLTSPLAGSQFLPARSGGCGRRRSAKRSAPSRSGRSQAFWKGPPLRRGWACACRANRSVPSGQSARPGLGDRIDATCGREVNDLPATIKLQGLNCSACRRPRRMQRYQYAPGHPADCRNEPARYAAIDTDLVALRTIRCACRWVQRLVLASTRLEPALQHRGSRPGSACPNWPVTSFEASSWWRPFSVAGASHLKPLP